MKILAYAIHLNVQYNRGYIGGAWIRFLEFLKRAEKFDTKYVVIETHPKLGKNYQSFLINVKNNEKFSNITLIVLQAIIKGVKRSLKGDIDLILSPSESLYCIFPAFVTSLLTKKPFTVIIHNTPVFHALLETYPDKKFTLSFKEIYKAINYRKHGKKSLLYIVLSSFLLLPSAIYMPGGRRLWNGSRQEIYIP